MELHAIDYSPAGDGAPPDRAAAEAEFVAARIAEMLRQEEKNPGRRRTAARPAR